MIPPLELAQHEINHLRAHNAQLLAALKDAQLALVDLGACDDPDCQDYACAHTLVRVDAAIAAEKGE